MRLRILSFGHKRDDAFSAAVADYQRRVVKPWSLELVDLPTGRKSESEAMSVVLAREAERLAGQGVVPSRTWALAVEGRALSSEAFAERLGKESEAGRAIDFVIGGADGLDDAIVRGAAQRVSLGPMTLPHRIARLVLAEQIYRAQAILRGLPYHK